MPSAPLSRGSRPQLLLAASMVGWRLTLPLLRRLLPFERLVRLTASPRAAEADSRRITSILRVGGRLWRDSSAPCLERSVCIHRQLGRVGATPLLVLGLAADHTGHAWVELDGSAVLEPSPPQLRFQELMRFGADGTLLTASDGARTADV
jgi:hypothetical protein